MKPTTKIAVLLGIQLVLGCATTGISTDQAIIRAKRNIEPALVHIRPVKEIFTEGRREEMLVIGSGFIISPDGYVVTNEHVAGSSRLVNCILSTKEEVEAEVIGIDRPTDIAVLKLKTENKNLPCAKLGKSAELQAGQTVLALGSPHGLARSVSKGIISMPERYLGPLEPTDIAYNNWIQTDAAINPGNSGGPLVNLKGEVVGINARKLGEAENVGFAIPIDVAKEVIDAIIKNGKVTRSWLGISFQEITIKTDYDKKEGVLISDVAPYSPAAQAGIRPGDVLLSIDDQKTTARFAEELPHINKMIADFPVGKETKLQILRGSESLEFTVKTEERTDLVGEETEFPEWGFTATNITPELARRLQLSSPEGILVSGVQVGGLAAAAELSRGDIILKVDDQPVPNMETFQKLYTERLNSKQRLILLDIRRGSLMRYILIKQENNSAPKG